MIARYSPIAPVALLKEMHSAGVLSNYLLLLAHDVLDDPVEYIELVQAMREEDATSPEEDQTFIIMDNSVIELGYALPSTKVIEAANMVDADCVLTPDVLGNKDATLKRVAEDFEVLKDSGRKLMWIPQGSNSHELVECVKTMKEEYLRFLGTNEMWAIPRWITHKIGSRIPLVQFINMTTDNPMIHLLGMSGNLNDDIRCTKLPNVIGIDSANPVVMGQKGIDLKCHHWVHMTREDLWEHKTITEETLLNVEAINNAVESRQYT